MVGLNTIEDLGSGIIRTHKRRTEFTILIVGETGAGKTTFLSLLANILQGNSPSTYATFNETANEAGGSERYSQTNEALLYTFKSKNGVRFRILDTPGLADTRGIGQDDQHKESIVRAIGDNITTVDAILILANGTVPRLGVATDYALSKLASMLPVTLAKNIGFLFTNLSSPLGWNFDEDSLPEILRDGPSFLLDNPVALWTRYLRERKKMEEINKVNQRRLKMLELSVEESHKKALGTFVEVFDWLDSLSPQPTIDILSLHDQLQEIGRGISNALATMEHLRMIKQELQHIERGVERLNMTIEQCKNYQSTITQRTYKQVETVNHNTLCAQPGCYSNCDENCTLSFSFDPRGLLGCCVFSGRNGLHSGLKCHPFNIFGNLPILFTWPLLGYPGLEGIRTCVKCGHSSNQHHHYNSRWELHEDSQLTIDGVAKRRHDDAMSEKAQQEHIMEQLRETAVTFQTALTKVMDNIGRLLEDHSRLSLSGGFASLVRKSASLLELALETARGNGASAQDVKLVEKALDRMQETLSVVEKAQGQSYGKLNAGRRFIGTAAVY